MKAVVNTIYGAPDVLEFKEVEKPIAGEQQVLVKVHAASINSWDWDYLKGKPYIYRLLFGITKPKHKILGADISGIVEAVGRNVSSIKIGDEVYGDLSGGNWGGFAEYVAADVNELATKPESLSFIEAASVPQAAVLALQGLQYHGGVKEGQKVLINGAGGGVGSFGIQLAKLFGAEVTAVDSGEKLDLLSALGADHVIDYTKNDFTKTGQEYDLILDVVANKSIKDYRKITNEAGAYVVIGGSVSTLLQIGLSGLWRKNRKRKIGLLVHKPKVEDLDYLTSLFEEGSLKAIVDKTFPLESLSEAFEYYGSGKVKGKMVIYM